MGKVKFEDKLTNESVGCHCTSVKSPVYIPCDIIKKIPKDLSINLYKTKLKDIYIVYDALDVQIYQNLMYYLYVGHIDHNHEDELPILDTYYVNQNKIGMVEYNMNTDYQELMHDYDYIEVKHNILYYRYREQEENPEDAVIYDPIVSLSLKTELHNDDAFIGHNEDDYDTTDDDTEFYFFKKEMIENNVKMGAIRQSIYVSERNEIIYNILVSSKTYKLYVYNLSIQSIDSYDLGFKDEMQQDIYMKIDLKHKIIIISSDSYSSYYIRIFDLDTYKQIAYLPNVPDLTTNYLVLDYDYHSYFKDNKYCKPTDKSYTKEKYFTGIKKGFFK